MAAPVGAFQAKPGCLGVRGQGRVAFARETRRLGATPGAAPQARLMRIKPLGRTSRRGAYRHLVQLVRRPRPLSERECYLRLYGTRTHLVEVLQARLARKPEPAPEGPTALGPAVHLAIRYPRGRGRMTGEELRVALEKRMRARPASGLPRAA